MERRLLSFECVFFQPAPFWAVRRFHPKVWLGTWTLGERRLVSKFGARSLVSLIPVSSMKKMQRAEQFSDDTDQPPRQPQCVRIGTEEVPPLDTEELY